MLYNHITVAILLYDHIIVAILLYDHIIVAIMFYDHIVVLKMFYDHIIVLIMFYDHIIVTNMLNDHIIITILIYDHIIAINTLHDHIIAINMLHYHIVPIITLVPIIIGLILCWNALEYLLNWNSFTSVFQLWKFQVKKKINADEIYNEKWIWNYCLCINVKINNSSSVDIYVIRIVLVKEMNAVYMPIRVFRFLY